MQQQNFRKCLSDHDYKVLESVFMPFGNVDDDSISAQFKVDIETELEEDNHEDQSAEMSESMKLELDGIKKAVLGKLDEAIYLFGRAILVAPNRASVFNNRAQALRLKENDEGALEDLLKAINLSEHQARTRCQALCQRGLLHRKLNNIDDAKKDFEEAAKLGSKFAKTQLIELNPYAALCNQMLQAAFEKLQ